MLTALHPRTRPSRAAAWPWLAALTAALMLALLPPTLAASVLVGVAFALLLLRRPVLGLFVLALALPAGPQLRAHVGGAVLGITDLLVLVTLGAWFLRFASGLQPLRPARILWLILPVVAALTLSTLAARSLELALPELFKWVEMALVLFLGAQLLEPRHHLPLLLELLFAASAEALIGLRQFWFRIGPDAYLLGSFLRAYGTFGQPNPYAGFLGLQLPLGVALTLWALRSVGQKRVHAQQVIRPLVLFGICAGLTLLIAAGLIASWSRGGWLGASLSVLVVLALSSAAGRLAILAAASGSLLIGPWLPAGSAALTGRLAGLGSYFGVWNVRGVPVTDENFAILERVAHWQAAWEMFADHPWLGIGVGNWEAIYPLYAIGQWTDPLGHAHNLLFHFAAEAGIVGAAAILWFGLGSLVWAGRVLRRGHGVQAAAAAGVIGLLMHLGVHNAFDNLFVQGIPLLVALALSLLNYQAALPPARPQPTPHVSPKLP